MISKRLILLFCGLGVTGCGAAVDEDQSYGYRQQAPTQSVSPVNGAAGAAGTGSTSMAGTSAVDPTQSTSQPIVIPPFPDLCTNYTPNEFVTTEICAGQCDSDQECLDLGLGFMCVALPGATRGTCYLWADNQLCATDEDCENEFASIDLVCVAVSADGIRRCMAPTLGCNNDDTCSPGLHCAVPQGLVLGTCTGGNNNDLCASDADCGAGMRCSTWSVEGTFDPAGGHWGVCSDGSPWSSCDVDGNCDEGRCLGHECSSGGLHEGCKVNADCSAELQCVLLEPLPNIPSLYPDVGFCSDGRRESFAQCDVQSQCASDNYCIEGMCMDGKTDALCDADSRCLSGRCAMTPGWAICTPGTPGASCVDTGDCESGICQPSMFGSDFGTCG
jgi:hypothetical protein